MVGNLKTDEAYFASGSGGDKQKFKGQCKNCGKIGQKWRSVDLDPTETLKALQKVVRLLGRTRANVSSVVKMDT